MRRACIIVLVLFKVSLAPLVCAASQQLSAGAVGASDLASSTACGPIACFFCSRVLHVNISLDEMKRRCNWQSGQRTSLQAMTQALNSMPELYCTSVHMHPDELLALLQHREYVVILPVRKTGNDIANHAIVALGTDGGNITTMDYPQLIHSRSIRDLEDVWNGDAIVVSRNPGPDPHSHFSTYSLGISGVSFMMSYVLIRFFAPLILLASHQRSSTCQKKC